MDGSGLLGGVTSYHLRMLVESEWNGGAGLSYEEVGRMTLDQIWHRLCDLEILKSKAKVESKSRSKTKLKPSEAMAQLGTTKNGFIKGRDRAGRPMQAKVRGKSRARQLMEEQAKRKVEEDKLRAKQKRQERRRRKRQLIEEMKNGTGAG